MVPSNDLLNTTPASLKPGDNRIHYKVIITVFPEKHSAPNFYLSTHKYYQIILDYLNILCATVLSKHIRRVRTVS